MIPATSYVRGIVPSDEQSGNQIAKFWSKNVLGWYTTRYESYLGQYDGSTLCTRVALNNWRCYTSLELEYQKNSTTKTYVAERAVQTQRVNNNISTWKCQSWVVEALRSLRRAQLFCLEPGMMRRMRDFSPTLASYMTSWASLLQKRQGRTVKQLDSRWSIWKERRRNGDTQNEI